MAAKLELSGKRFGMLKVICDTGKRPSKEVLWECKCLCGETTEVTSYRLKGGLAKSCGCGVGKSAALRFRKHGKSRTLLYGVWKTMKTRCYNPEFKFYCNYGGRGITVCKRWINSFEAFDADMGPAFFEGATLERKNNNRNYTPGNCKWATRVEQARNKRNSRIVIIEGISRTIPEWSEVSGVHIKTITMRLNRGWPISRLLEPARYITPYW